MHRCIDYSWPNVDFEHFLIFIYYSIVAFRKVCIFAPQEKKKMNLSKTAKYAIRVVSYMALKKQELYSAAHLIQVLGVSDKYLKRILTILSNHNIIKSVQGRYGGFRLNKSTDDIYLYEIINTVEDIDKYLGCVLGFSECSCETPCSLHYNWGGIKQEFAAFLKNTSISEVLKNPEILKF